MQTWMKIVPLVMFCAYLAKLAILGATFADGLSLAIVAGFSAYLIHKPEAKNFEDLANKIKHLEETMAEKNKEIETIKNYTVGLKLGQNLKATSIR